MRCEKCGSELFRGALVCRHCRFDNGQRGRSIAAKGGHALAVEGPAARAVTSSAGNAGVRTATREVVARVSASESEGNLIPFPVGTPFGGASQTIQIPPVRTRETEGPLPPSWREQVREKVKASRERKGETSVSPASATPASPAPPATPSTPSTPPPLPQAKETAGSADSRRHNELVESALNRIRRTTADLTASAPAPSAIPAPPPVARPVARQEAPRPVPPIRAEERPASAPAPAPPAASPREALPPTPSVARERSEARQVVTVPPTAPPTRARTTDELVQDARRLAQQTAPPVEAPPQPEPVSQPTARPHVKTEVIPLSALLRSLGMQEDRPASIWIRSMAGGWDLEVLAVAYLPIFASYATVNTVLARETLVVLAALLVVLVFVYQAVTLLLAGRTFGMAMQQVRLAPLTAGETRIYWHQHLRRAAGATLAFCCPPLNLLARALHRRGLSLPDQFSGTIPVEIPRSPRPR